MKILMVCLGNICRSPLAEGILQNLANKNGLNWQVDSAGTESYHIGNKPHHLSIKVAAAHGIDISQQKAAKFKAEHFNQYDIVYAMAEDIKEEIKDIAASKFDPKKLKLILEESNTPVGKNVPDPYYGGEDGFYEVFNLLLPVCEQIITKYKDS
jgi:protein-tyrosine phosphatase